MSLVIDFSELKAPGVLPSARGVMLSVMRLCERDPVSFPDLARNIQADPVLAGRIIKIANAGNRNAARPVASVTPDILVVIGLQAVRQVVLGLSLAATNRSGGCSGFDYERFWTRSVAMACAAQQIAGRVPVSPVAEVFTCGLLAGFGQLGLASTRPVAYSGLLQQMAGHSREELIQAETAMFAFNRLSLAAAMMADSNIPRLFSEAVLHHANPQASGLPPDSRQQRLAQVLHAAAAMADFCVGTEEERERIMPDLRTIGDPLDLTTRQIEVIMAGLSREWGEWSTTLQIPVPGLPPLRL